MGLGTRGSFFKTLSAAAMWTIKENHMGLSKNEQGFRYKLTMQRSFTAVVRVQLSKLTLTSNIHCEIEYDGCPTSRFYPRSKRSCCV